MGTLTCHNCVTGLCWPVKMQVPLCWIRTSVRVKVASQSASHNWVIDNKDHDLSSGMMCTHLVSKGSCGKSS